MFEALLKELAAKGHDFVVSHFLQKKLISNYTDFYIEGSLLCIPNSFTLGFAIT
jgi:hypothetical protein